jgi:predicted DNA-binding transcriptional regulator YafY
VKALADNRVITFDYTGTWDEKPCPRRVRPYQLLFDTGVWFLYGFDEDQAGLRMFSLARTQNARLRDQGFTLPDDYDYRLRVDGSRFGVFAGGERRRFRVVFYGEAVVWAEERQWAADQRVEEFEEEGETCCVVEFTSAQYEKVLEWVLSKGCNARPLEPPELAVDWRYHIAELAKMV